VNDWAMAGFVSRVADRVTTAGEDLVAQIADRYNPDLDDVSVWTLRLPMVEPSGQFVEDLGRRLLGAPVEVVGEGRFPDGGRWIVYGAAAVGSLASAAVLVALILRNRSVGRAAA
jgi:hypothetical protein